MPNGDPRMIAELLPDQMGFLIGLARRFKWRDPEDLVQETLYRALRFAATFTPTAELGIEGSLRNWLATIMRSRLATAARHDKPFNMRDLQVVITPAAQEDSVYLSEVCERIWDDGQCDLIIAAIDATYDELSTTFSIPVGTVRSRLSRARARIAG